MKTSGTALAPEVEELVNTLLAKAAKGPTVDGEEEEEWELLPFFDEDDQVWRCPSCEHEIVPLCEPCVTQDAEVNELAESLAQTSVEAAPAAEVTEAAQKDNEFVPQEDASESESEEEEVAASEVEEEDDLVVEQPAEEVAEKVEEDDFIVRDEDEEEEEEESSEEEDDDEDVEGEECFECTVKKPISVWYCTGCQALFSPEDVKAHAVEHVDA